MGARRLWTATVGGQLETRLRYHFYRGRYSDAIHEVLDPNLKTIVHIPSVRSAASTTNKYDEVDHILDHLGTVLGKDKKTGFYLVETADGKKLKVADLVDDGPDRETVGVLFHLVHPRNPHPIDVASKPLVTSRKRTVPAICITNRSSP